MDEWLANARDVVARAAGAEPSALTLTEDEIHDLLAVARIAAHVSGDRRNAPLLCYLVGHAVARGGSVEGIAAALRDTA